MPLADASSAGIAEQRQNLGGEIPLDARGRGAFAANLPRRLVLFDARTTMTSEKPPHSAERLQ